MSQQQSEADRNSEAAITAASDLKAQLETATAKAEAETAQAAALGEVAHLC